MKIVFLNIYYANCTTDFTDFIEREASTTDVFCFQEARPSERRLLKPILSDFTEYSCDKILDNGENFNVATYVRKGIRVVSTSSFLEPEQHCGLLLKSDLLFKGNHYSVVNTHGMSYRTDDKLDTPGRLLQSSTILNTVRNNKRHVVIGGDFNILPDTESIKMISGAGYRDMIAENEVKTTRNRLAWDRFPHNPQYFADYIFTSPDLLVGSFEVPEIEVSDHLPLIVEVEPLGGHAQLESLETVQVRQEKMQVN